MARKRERSQTSTTTQVAQATETKERVYNMALSAEQIQAIYAKRRTKGQYTGLLDTFLTSGENGIDVKAEHPELKDKKAQTIKQGFEGAKNNKNAPEGADMVDVVVDGENVFLLNRQVLGEEAQAA